MSLCCIVGNIVRRWVTVLYPLSIAISDVFLIVPVYLCEVFFVLFCTLGSTLDTVFRVLSSIEENKGERYREQQEHYFRMHVYKKSLL